MGVYERRKFKAQQRVVHANHGAGTVLLDSDEWEALVEFDVQPDGWGKTLCVSVGALREELNTDAKR